MPHCIQFRFADCARYSKGFHSLPGEPCRSAAGRRACIFVDIYKRETLVYCTAAREPCQTGVLRFAREPIGGMAAHGRTPLSPVDTVGRWRQSFPNSVSLNIKIRGIKVKNHRQKNLAQVGALPQRSGRPPCATAARYVKYFTQASAKAT
jgi:hypothetical protein